VRFGVAVITAEWPVVCRVVTGALAVVSAGGGLKRFEFLKRGEEVCCPGPCVL
jgi:hypothetical protein